MIWLAIACLIFVAAVVWTVADHLRGADECPHCNPDNWGK